VSAQQSELPGPPQFPCCCRREFGIQVRRRGEEDGSYITGLNAVGLNHFVKQLLSGSNDGLASVFWNCDSTSDAAALQFDVFPNFGVIAYPICWPSSRRTCLTAGQVKINL
jgi:hypothetical protein